ncbi:MAG: bifunctional 5,10-methylenetetrahydrofolate dehydrogenase/5,10-methenyltetrahydrofolate cyclohydrolase [Ureaplasma sp.]|nr:bifunctional 5,10-methylenetetrahydrofolate dehydrogenase/5,10-methenyltetrahydrofolate cyclohydrolase [Ureaplasma sp.]
MIIDCTKIANKIIEEVKSEINIIKSNNIIPKIVILNSNNNIETKKFIQHKKNLAESLGVQCEILTNFNNQKSLINCIKKINEDCSVHGYIIQLPLKSNFKLDEIIEHIDIKKDIDGISHLAISRNFSRSNNFYNLTCTCQAILKIIENQKYKLSGKNVVIINRKEIIGKPLIANLLEMDATVTVCHSKTKNLNHFTNNADLLITAIGKPNYFKKRMIKKNAFVIDAGISYLNNKPVGDVDFEQVKTQAKYLTPVPNGVGKITVAMIFKNLVNLIKNYIETKK